MIRRRLCLRHQIDVVRPEILSRSVRTWQSPAIDLLQSQGESKVLIFLDPRGDVRRNRLAGSRASRRSVRRRVLLGRLAPHAGSSCLVRGRGAVGEAGRCHRARPVQSLRARSAQASPGGSEAHRIACDSVRSRPARPRRRTRATRGMASRSIPAPRGALPHRGRSPDLVSRQRRRIPPHVPDDAPWCSAPRSRGTFHGR